MQTALVILALVCLAFAILTARLRRSLQQARRAAESDDLTQLLNRRGFERRLQAESNRCQRTGRPLAVAFLDCDDFKKINDSLGHVTGDRLLRTVAQTLEHNVRNYDSVARMGGDEFAILFPEMPPDQAQSAADRLVNAVRSAMQSHNWDLGVSAGIVVFEQPADVDEMLAAADREMYAAKRTGKGRARVRVVSRPSADNSSPAA